jgi:energy-coupling factor transporter transmembrane protein EcfT
MRITIIITSAMIIGAVFASDHILQGVPGSAVCVTNVCARTISLLHEWIVRSPPPRTPEQWYSIHIFAFVFYYFSKLAQTAHYEQLANVSDRP